MNFAAIVLIIEKGLVLLLPFILLAIPLGVVALRKYLSDKDRLRLLAATKGAVLILGEIAKRTTTTIDDALVQVLKLVETELGKPLNAKQGAAVRSMALTLHADPRFPARITVDEHVNLLRAALAHAPAAEKANR